MLAIVLFLRGIGKQLTVEYGVLKGLPEPTDATSSQHSGAARANRVSPIVILFYAYLFGTLALVLWGFITEEIHGLVIALNATGWALLVILSLGPTLFGYLLFTVSLRYLSAPIASIFHTLEPVMTALLAFFLLGRILTAIQWLGLGLIVISVTVMQLSTLLHSGKTPLVSDRDWTPPYEGSNSKANTTSSGSKEVISRASEESGQGTP